MPIAINMTEITELSHFYENVGVMRFTLDTNPMPSAWKINATRSELTFDYHAEDNSLAIKMKCDIQKGLLVANLAVERIQGEILDKPKLLTFTSATPDKIQKIEYDAAKNGVLQIHYTIIHSDEISPKKVTQSRTWIGLSKLEDNGILNTAIQVLYHLSVFETVATPSGSEAAAILAECFAQLDKKSNVFVSARDALTYLSGQIAWDLDIKTVFKGIIGLIKSQANQRHPSFNHYETLFDAKKNRQFEIVSSNGGEEFF